MATSTRVRGPSELRVTPNLTNHDAAGLRDFLDRSHAALDGLPGGRGLNIAYDAVDRLLAQSDVAPEADPPTLRTDVDLRDQLDIDSMDSLNFVIGIHERAGVDIPDAEWARLQTLDQVVDYVSDRIAA